MYGHIITGYLNVAVESAVFLVAQLDGETAERSNRFDRAVQRETGNS
jgi:hypothetical protein